MKFVLALSVLALSGVVFAYSAHAEEMTMTVGPHLADCIGSHPQKCMMIKDGNGNWEYFYDQIEGFEFVQGNEYVLVVSTSSIPNPPADASSIEYSMANVISQESSTWPPLKQTKLGIADDDVLCKAGLSLIFKTNGNPLCVSSDTAESLYKRWGMLDDESRSQTIIKTGTYAGLCLGYCIHDFVITSEKILYSQKGLEFVSDVREKLPVKIKQIPISESKWQELTDSIDLQKFNSIPERIGCPGCADGIVEWIEISDGKKTKKIEFEPKDSIPEINELVIMLREIRNTAASSITTFEECIAAGNPVMESYPRQCRTVNGEHFVEEIDEDVRAPTPEITGKRSPVDVPDATNENDMLCQTHWNIETTDELNTEHIKKSVQSTIAQFGMTYLLEEREVVVYESSSGYVVSISGLWEPGSVQYLMITEEIEKISGVKIQGEPAMCI